MDNSILMWNTLNRLNHYHTIQQCDNTVADYIIFLLYDISIVDYYSGMRLFKCQMLIN